MATDSSHHPPRRHAVGLAALLLAGLAIRLVYGAYEPNIRRFWDERYAVMNVRSILAERTLVPAKSYYPSPVFNLPAAAIVAGADALNESLDRGSERVYEDGRFGADAFVLLRWLQALYGAIAIALTFRIARRLISPTAAWIAAVLIAFMPWAIHASGIFKPDALLLAAVLLAFDLSLSAVRRPDLWRFVLAGGGIALAMSAKLTGALIAVSLVAGCCWPGEDRLRRLAGLMAAGATTLAVFFLLNPYGRYYLDFLGGLKEDYTLRTDVPAEAWWTIPGQAIGFLLQPTTFGPVFGLLAMLGLVTVAGAVLRGSSPSGERCGLAMMAIYPPVFTVAYATQTIYFKPNNFLPTLPFFAFGLVWIVDRLSRRAGATRRMPSAARRALSLLLLAAFVAPGVRYVYQSLTPMTYDLALARLERPLRPKPGRTVLVEERARASWIAWEGRADYPLDGSVALRVVESLDELPVAEIGGADALVFPLRRTARGDPLYAEWSSDPAHRTIEIESRAFEVRGVDLLIVDRRWRPIKPSLDARLSPCDDEGTCWRIEAPREIAAGTTMSLLITVGRSRVKGYHQPRLSLPHDAISTHLASTRSDVGGRWVSERFHWTGAALTVRLDYPIRRGRPPEVDLHRWRRPG